MLLTKLKETNYNPRIITDEELENLKASIVKHTSAVSNDDGYRLASTITVNKQGNRIIGGHQRVKALKALGQDWIHEDDITWVDIEPDSLKEKALNVSLNNQKSMGKFDDDKLKDVVKDIMEQNKLLFSDLNFGNLDVKVVEEKLPEINNSFDGKIKDEEPELHLKSNYEYENDKFILVYINEEEKKFWMDKFNLPYDKIVWRVGELRS